MKTQLLLFITLLQFINLNAQTRVGDPGVNPDISKYDSNYPQMERWAKTGVRGGIPFIDSFDKTATINPGKSADINAAITAMANSLSGDEKGLITLKKGRYTIDQSVFMKSNVSLRGESRDSVQCWVTQTASKEVGVFEFNNVSNCGLYNMTIEGSWGKPIYDWNYGIAANRETNNAVTSVRLKGGTTDCWVDKVTILYSVWHAVSVNGYESHNTFRDLIVDGAYRKYGGGEGYFIITGKDNLVTGCKITHLRHFTLQGGKCEYNVIYDNELKQEFSFHVGDNGNNLAENNRITLPADMPNGYTAFMGPWSSQHTISKKPNYLFKNKCYEYNQNGNPTPWSDDNIVYYGPHVVKPSTLAGKHNNFTDYNKGIPQGGTLYAVLLGDTEPVTGVSLPETLELSKNNTKLLKPNFQPSNAHNKKVTWKSDNESIVTVSASGELTGISNGKAFITVTTDDGSFEDVCEVMVITKELTSLSIEPSSIELVSGEKKKLKLVFEPADASYKELTWASDNQGVAKVDADGNVTAVAKGSAIITAKTVVGEFSTVCAVTVPDIEYVELYPIHDAYTQGSAGYNTNDLKCEGTYRETYLMFDLSSLPQNINNAELRLSVGGDAGSGILKVLKGEHNNWSEDSFSASEAPTADEELGSKTGSFDIGNTYTWTLNTSKIKGGEKLTLVVTQSDGSDVWFSSKEAADDAQKPMLTVIVPASSPLGFEDVRNLNLISVYPNPIGPSGFTVDLNRKKALKNVNIFNQQGQIVYSESTSSISLYVPNSVLPSKGIYMIRINCEGDVVVRKIVKQ